MAYNPFNIFRRNQKAFFAVLTVIIMIIFTLSSGVMGADFFENFTQWLGSKSRRGDVVCTIDGNKVYQRDLDQLQLNRRMANQYMVLLALTTASQLDRAVSDQLPRLSPEARGIISQVNFTEERLGDLARDPFRAQLIPTIIDNMRSSLQRIIDSPTMTAEDKDIARTKLAKFILVESLRQGDFYFAFAPNRTNRDKLDFMLWQKKADQLGIRFTPDDVGRLVRKELFGYLSDEVQKEVQKRMASEFQNFTMSACLKALGEEFRVRTAQVAVLGPDVHGGRGDKTYGGFPMFNPPYEAFEFYREFCSPSSYATIPVPAANLIAEVDRRLLLPAGNPDKIPEPTETELRNLFDKYKDAMASPDKETPGFKIPPRIRLEFFQLTGEEPYYKAEAEKALKNEVLQTNLWSVMSAQGFGSLPGVVALNTRAFLNDPLLTRVYSEKVREHNQNQTMRYGSPDVDFRPGFLGNPILESSVVRPGSVAVAVSGVGGQLGALGNPFAGLAVVVGGPMAYEIRDRVRIGMPAVLGMVPSPGMFNTAMGGAAAYHTMLPKPLPIEAYRGEFMQTLVADKAKEIAFGRQRLGDEPIVGDVDKFIEEVRKLSEKGRARDMGPAQKYIAEFVAKRGLTLQGNKTPRTEWDLEDDLELAPLLAAQKESLHDPSSPHSSDYTPFGQSFFWEFSFMTGGRTPASGRYMPQSYPPGGRMETGKPRFLVWRSEEVAATQMDFWTEATKNDSTKAAVKDAWKLIKARELAKAKADAIAEGIRAHIKAIEAGGAGKVSEINLIPFIRDEAEKLRVAAPADTKAQRRAMPFPIRGVCPLTSLAGNPAGEVGLPSFGTFDRPILPGPVQGFQLPPSENIKFPSTEMRNTILDDRTKPPGTVLVLPDRPKDTYYIVTLVKRDEKTENDYLTQVASGRLSEQFGGPTILNEFRVNASRKTILSIRALLKQEFKYEESEDQKKKLDENDRLGGDNN